MSPSGLVRFVHSLPHGAGLDSSGSTFARPSASSQSGYSESVLVFPLLLNCLLALPVLLAITLLAIRACGKPPLPRVPARRRSLLAWLVAAAFLAFVAAHLLWLGDDIYSKGMRAAASKLDSLRLSFQTEALLGAQASADASLDSALLQKRFDSSSCAQALAGIGSVQSVVQLNADAIALNVGAVSDGFQTAVNFVRQVGETYRAVFVGLLYGLSVLLLGLFGLGLARRWKALLQPVVFVALTYCLGSLCLCGTMLVLLIVGADFCQDPGHNFAVAFLSANSSAATSLVLDYFASCPTGGSDPIDSWAQLALQANQEVIANVTAAQSSGCGAVLDYPTFDATSGDLSSQLTAAGQLSCNGISGTLLAALDTDLCSQAFEGGFFQLTLVYLIAGFLFLVAVLAALILPYYDLEKEEAAAAVSRASFGTPSRAVSGRKEGAADHTRNASVRSNGHSPASRHGSLRDQQALLPSGVGSGSGGFLVHDFQEFVLPDGKVVMRPVLRTEEMPSRKESIRQQESQRRRQESQRRDSLRSQRLEAFPKPPSVRQQDDFVSAAYRPVPPARYSESHPAAPPSDRQPVYRDPYFQPQYYEDRPQYYTQRDPSTPRRGSDELYHREYLPSPPHPASPYWYSGDGARSSQQRSSDYYSPAEGPQASHYHPQPSSRSHRRSRTYQDYDERSQGSGEGEVLPPIIKSSGHQVDLSENPAPTPPSKPGPLFYTAGEVNTVMQAQLDAIYKIYGTALFYPSVDPEDSYSEADVRRLLQESLDRHGALIRAANKKASPPSVDEILSQHPPASARDRTGASSAPVISSKAFMRRQSSESATTPRLERPEPERLSNDAAEKRVTVTSPPARRGSEEKLGVRELNALIAREARSVFDEFGAVLYCPPMAGGDTYTPELVERILAEKRRMLAMFESKPKFSALEVNSFLEQQAETIRVRLGRDVGFTAVPTGKYSNIRLREVLRTQLLQHMKLFAPQARSDNEAFDALNRFLYSC